ncbi:MAG: toll/interleukin-1 receptor domain-containing protein [Chloroflexi bacterium]|nr:toll/interleukin-1 receptor domain-containing protein [Chloroflexota bacterium]
MTRDFTVAMWGKAIPAEVVMAVYEANSLQKAFAFFNWVGVNSDVIQLNADRYLIRDRPTGEPAYDLDRAGKNLLRRKAFNQIKTGELILVTSLPYSEVGAIIDEPDPLGRGLYFWDDGVVSNKKRFSIISTYVWEHLEPRPDLLALKPTGRRYLVPYLLLAFSMIAFAQRLDLPYHKEDSRYWDCPLHYNHHVREIDYFFNGGSFCPDCVEKIRDQWGHTREAMQELHAIKRLQRAAAGKPAAPEFDVALSFAGTERSLAQELYDLLEARGIHTFYDAAYPERLAAEDLNIVFEEVFARRSQFCVIFVSREYATRVWTNHELRSALSRQLIERGGYIIPIQVEDGVELLGIPATIGRLPLSRHSIRAIASIIAKKVEESI